MVSATRFALSLATSLSYSSKEAALSFPGTMASTVADRRDELTAAGSVGAREQASNDRPFAVGLRTVISDAIISADNVVRLLRRRRYQRRIDRQLSRRPRTNFVA